MSRCAWFFAAMLAVSFAANVYLSRRPRAVLRRVSDTVTVTETVVRPVPVVRERVRYVRVRLPGDTVVRTDTVQDSVTVYVPVERKVYEGADYRAVVSGYMASLDTLSVSRRVVRSRWSFGLSGGVGMTPSGVQPYVGVGLTYRLGK